jgi:hypothetical protein
MVNDREDGGVIKVMKFIVILATEVKSLVTIPVKTIPVVVLTVEFELVKEPE